MKTKSLPPYAPTLIESTRASLQEQFIIKSIYFDDMKQKDVAEILGVTKGALSQRLNTILRKMRNMYMEG